MNDVKFLKSERAFYNPLLAVFLIAVTCAVIYSNTLDGPFIFDDEHVIRDSERIRNVSNYLRFDQSVLQRPFVNLTFSLNYQFGQLNVRGYHVINMLIHMINGVIVYFLSGAILTRLLRSTKSPPFVPSHESPNTGRETPISLIALFTALIFVAHPLQTQAVTYICQRYASLAALFYILSVLFYLKGRMVQRSRLPEENSGQKTGLPEMPRSRSAGTTQVFVLYILCILSGILAFLSKQTAASLPLIILLVEVLCIDNSWAGWKKKLPWAGLALLLIVTAALLVSGRLEGTAPFGSLLEDISRETRETETVSRWNYLCTQFTVITTYIRMLFLPLGQNADVMLPFKTGFFDGLTPLMFLFLAAIILFAVWVRKKMPVVPFGVFWFFITLSVESSVIPIRDAMFEHRLYLPMFGFAIGLSATVFQWFSSRRFYPVILMVCITFVFGAAAYHRNRVWQSSETLWTDVLSKAPHNYRAHTNLGIAFLDEDQFTAAAEEFQESLKLNPKAKAYYNLGIVFAELGEPETAIEHYLKAIEMDTRHSKAMVNLGVVLLKQEKFREAANRFEQALKIDPGSVEAHVNLGAARMNTGNMDGAIQSCSEALRLDGKDPFANFYLGLALIRTGNPDAAKAYLLKALEINPEWAMAHRQMGLLFAKQRDMDGALLHFSEVVRITPESGEAHFHLGLAMVRKGDREGGIRELSEAVRLEPGSMKFAGYLERIKRR